MMGLKVILTIIISLVSRYYCLTDIISSLNPLFVNTLTSIDLKIPVNDITKKEFSLRAFQSENGNNVGSDILPFSDCITRDNLTVFSVPDGVFKPLMDVMDVDVYPTCYIDVIFNQALDTDRLLFFTNNSDDFLEVVIDNTPIHSNTVKFVPYHNGVPVEYIVVNQRVDLKIYLPFDPAKYFVPVVYEDILIEIPIDKHLSFMLQSDVSDDRMSSVIGVALRKKDSFIIRLHRPVQEFYLIANFQTPVTDYLLPLNVPQFNFHGTIIPINIFTYAELHSSLTTIISLRGAHLIAGARMVYDVELVNVNIILSSFRITFHIDSRQSLVPRDLDSFCVGQLNSHTSPLSWEISSDGEVHINIIDINSEKVRFNMFRCSFGMVLEEISLYNLPSINSFIVYKASASSVKLLYPRPLKLFVYRNNVIFNVYQTENDSLLHIGFGRQYFIDAFSIFGVQCHDLLYMTPDTLCDGLTLSEIQDKQPLLLQDSHSFNDTRLLSDSEKNDNNQNHYKNTHADNNFIMISTPNRFTGYDNSKVYASLVFRNFNDREVVVGDLNGLEMNRYVVGEPIPKSEHNHSSVLNNNILVTSNNTTTSTMGETKNGDIPAISETKTGDTPTMGETKTSDINEQTKMGDKMGDINQQKTFGSRGIGGTGVVDMRGKSVRSCISHNVECTEGEYIAGDVLILRVVGDFEIHDKLLIDFSSIDPLLRFHCHDFNLNTPRTEPFGPRIYDRLHGCTFTDPTNSIDYVLMIEQQTFVITYKTTPDTFLYLRDISSFDLSFSISTDHSLLHPTTPQNLPIYLATHDFTPIPVFSELSAFIPVIHPISHPLRHTHSLSGFVPPHISVIDRPTAQNYILTLSRDFIHVDCGVDGGLTLEGNRQSLLVDGVWCEVDDRMRVLTCERNTLDPTRHTIDIPIKLMPSDIYRPLAIAFDQPHSHSRSSVNTPHHSHLHSSTLIYHILPMNHVQFPSSVVKSNPLIKNSVQSIVLSITFPIQPQEIHRQNHLTKEGDFLIIQVKNARGELRFNRVVTLLDNPGLVIGYIDRFTHNRYHSQFKSDAFNNSSLIEEETKETPSDPLHHIPNNDEGSKGVFFKLTLAITLTLNDIKSRELKLMVESYYRGNVYTSLDGVDDSVMHSSKSMVENTNFAENLPDSEVNYDAIRSLVEVDDLQLEMVYHITSPEYSSQHIIMPTLRLSAFPISNLKPSLVDIDLHVTPLYFTRREDFSPEPYVDLNSIQNSLVFSFSKALGSSIVSIKGIHLSKYDSAVPLEQYITLKCMDAQLDIITTQSEHTINLTLSSITPHTPCALTFSTPLLLSPIVYISTHSSDSHTLSAEASFLPSYLDRFTFSFDKLLPSPIAKPILTRFNINIPSTDLNYGAGLDITFDGIHLHPSFSLRCVASQTGDILILHSASISVSDDLNNHELSSDPRSTLSLHFAKRPGFTLAIDCRLFVGLLSHTPSPSIVSVTTHTIVHETKLSHSYVLLHPFFPLPTLPPTPHPQVKIKLITRDADNNSHQDYNAPPHFPLHHVTVGERSGLLLNVYQQYLPTGTNIFMFIPAIFGDASRVKNDEYEDSLIKATSFITPTGLYYANITLKESIIGSVQGSLIFFPIGTETFACDEVEVEGSYIVDGKTYTFDEPISVYSHTVFVNILPNMLQHSNIVDFIISHRLSSGVTVDFFDYTINEQNVFDSIYSLNCPVAEVVNTNLDEFDHISNENANILFNRRRIRSISVGAGVECLVKVVVKSRLSIRDWRVAFTSSIKNTFAINASSIPSLYSSTSSIIGYTLSTVVNPPFNDSISCLHPIMDGTLLTVATPVFRFDDQVRISAHLFTSLPSRVYLLGHDLPNNTKPRDHTSTTHSSRLFASSNNINTHQNCWLDQYDIIRELYYSKKDNEFIYIPVYIDDFFFNYEFTLFFDEFPVTTLPSTFSSNVPNGNQTSINLADYVTITPNDKVPPNTNIPFEDPLDLALNTHNDLSDTDNYTHLQFDDSDSSNLSKDDSSTIFNSHDDLPETTSSTNNVSNLSKDDLPHITSSNSSNLSKGNSPQTTSNTGNSSVSHNLSDNNNPILLKFDSSITTIHLLNIQGGIDWSNMYLSPQRNGSIGVFSFDLVIPRQGVVDVIFDHSFTPVYKFSRCFYVYDKTVKLAQVSQLIPGSSNVSLNITGTKPTSITCAVHTFYSKYIDNDIDHLGSHLSPSDTSVPMINNSSSSDLSDISQVRDTEMLNYVGISFLNIDSRYGNLPMIGSLHRISFYHAILFPSLTNIPYAKIIEIYQHALTSVFPPDLSDNLHGIQPIIEISGLYTGKDMLVTVVIEPPPYLPPHALIPELNSTSIRLTNRNLNPLLPQILTEITTIIGNVEDLGLVEVFDFEECRTTCGFQCYRRCQISDMCTYNEDCVSNNCVLGRCDHVVKDQSYKWLIITIASSAVLLILTILGIFCFIRVKRNNKLQEKLRRIKKKASKRRKLMNMLMQSENHSVDQSTIDIPDLNMDDYLMPLNDSNVDEDAD